MSLIPPPSPPSTHPVMLKVAYPHPPRPLSRSIALTRQSTLDQPSRVRTTQLLDFRVDDGQGERAGRGREPGPTDPGVADREGGAHLGVTAQPTTPESRWRRRGRGSSMSHAWATNGPVSTASTGRSSRVSHERTRMTHCPPAGAWIATFQTDHEARNQATK